MIFQVEELDELSGQVQILENEKTKVEMTMQQLKKEHKHDLEVKEEEIEDVRHALGKKMKVLEQQLEEEHEDRIGFLREKHEMEGKILNLTEMLERSAEDEGLVAKLKKDLKRTKALLKDAHHVVENSQTEGTSKVIIRQLKNQVNCNLTLSACLLSHSKYFSFDNNNFCKCKQAHIFTPLTSSLFSLRKQNMHVQQLSKPSKAKILNWQISSNR